MYIPYALSPIIGRAVWTQRCRKLITFKFVLLSCRYFEKAYHFIFFMHAFFICIIRNLLYLWSQKYMSRVFLDCNLLLEYDMPWTIQLYIVNKDKIKVLIVHHMVFSNDLNGIVMLFSQIDWWRMSLRHTCIGNHC